MKKTLQLLFLVFGATLVSAQNIGDTFNGANNLSYKITSTSPNEAEISGFTTPGNVTADYDLVIPETEDGYGNTYSITAVGLGAFSGNTASNRGGEGFASDYQKIKTVSLPTSVTHLAIHAFRDLPILTTINLDNIVSTENSVFATCALLSDVGTLSSLQTLGNYAIFSCPSLTSINVGNSATTIGNNFLRDTGITAIQYNWSNAELPTAVAGFLSSNYLTDVDPTTVTLYVPAGTKTAYEASAFFITGMTVVEGSLSTDVVAKEFGFNIYPNPVNDVIVFENNQLKNATINITGLNGNTILTSKANNLVNRFDVSNLASGLYLMKVTTDAYTFVQKIVKK